MKQDPPYALHIWVSLWALGPIALCAMSFTHDWPILAKVVTSIFAATTILLFYDIFIGRNFVPFNGNITAMGFLIQMVFLIAILILPDGVIRGFFGAALVFCNWTNFTILKRAIDGLPTITPDNPRGE